MSPTMRIALSPSRNPRRYLRDTVTFLLEKPGRCAIASGPPGSRKSEFALRCAYHLARQKKVSVFSAEIYPNVLAQRLFSWYGREQICRRDLLISATFGWSINAVRTAIESQQCSIVVIDSINLMDVEQTDLEKLAQELKISILCTRVTVK